MVHAPERRGLVSSGVLVGLLGNLMLTGDDGTMPVVSAPKERAVLSLLGLRAGTYVRLSDFYAAVWGDNPPVTAQSSVRTYVSNLRNRLGKDLIETVDNTSYRLRVSPDDVDITRFERLVRAADEAVGEDDPHRVLAHCAEAAALWRGDPLPDLADHALGMAEAARLTEMHRSMEERGFDARLATGDLDALIGDLETAIGREPLRERRWELLMLALYRSGRQGEALRAFRRLQSVLRDELGIEPGPRAQDLESAILDQDPALSPPAQSQVAAMAPEPRLPSGNVTFLVAELQEPDQAAPLSESDRATAMEWQRRILRSTVSAHRGVDFGADTGIPFVVFGDAGEAVSACLEIQTELAAEVASHGAGLPVRMGLHTGLARPNLEGAYPSQVIQEAARISGAAHGGQVLLSAETARIVRNDLPAGSSLADRGSFLLSGSDEPERIFQLVHPSLESTFPPLLASPAHSHNLPDIRMPFIGRDADIKAVEDLVATEGVVTVVGPGGSGKTRLAVEVGARLAGSFEDGVRLCDLSPLRDPNLVTAAVCGAVGITDPKSADPRAALIDNLRGRGVLLILDNCEHVTTAAATLAETLLAAVPQLKVLATSRQALGLGRERVWRLGPLAVPAPGDGAEAVAGCESAALFQNRARLVQPSFEVTERNAPAVAAICRQVEGLPLAIELAAAQVASLDPAAIAERLRHRRADPGTRSPQPAERHRTLEATVDWSYQLLEPEARRLLRYLSVFANGFTVDAVESISDAADAIDRLAGLVDSSLVVWDFDADRYRLLEPIRAFCRDRLVEAGEEDAASARHLSWCAGVAGSLRADSSAGDAYELFNRELDNFRAALRWATDHATVDGDRLADAVRRPPDPNPPERAAEQASEWEVSIAADRAYFDRLDVEGVEFPDSSVERRFALTGSEVVIGRTSRKRGTRADIDLSYEPLDPGVSHEQAILFRQADGAWSVLDPGSMNGIFLNDTTDTLPLNRATRLQEGDRLHVGAWTTITLHRRC